MKFWESSHIFQHPWSTVSQAFWRKYPNEYQRGVEGTDVIERYVSDDGKLHSKRLIISSWNVPAFMRVFVSDPRAYAVEYSIVDPKAKTLTLRSQNISAEGFFIMHENVVYCAAEDDTTQLHHEARIGFDSHVSKYIDNAAEDWTASLVSDAAGLGRRAMDSVINLVEEETRSAMDAIDKFSFSDTIDSSIDYIDSSIDSLKQDVGSLTDSLTRDHADVIPS